MPLNVFQYFHHMGQAGLVPRGKVDPGNVHP